MDGIDAFLHAWQHRPAHQRDEADGEDDERERRRPGEERNGREVVTAVDDVEPRIHPVEHPEGREDRQEPERRNDQQQHRVDERVQRAPAGRRGRLRRQFGLVDHAHLAGGRAVPDFVRADPCARGNGGQVLQLRALADGAAVLDHAGRADIGVGADIDAPDDHLVADDAHVGELQLRAERGARADGHEIDRAGFHFADDGVFADLRAHRREIEPHDRRGLEPFDVAERDQVLRQPPAEVIGPPQGVAAGLGAAEQQPLRPDRDQDRRQIDAEIDAQQRDDFRQQARVGIRQQHVADEDAEPLRGHQAENEGQRNRLREPAQEPP